MAESSHDDWLLHSGQASCPAKIMLAGEYDVVDGGPALLLAINRRARARLLPRVQRPSPFVKALEQVLAQRYGETSISCRAAAHVHVDTSSFREDREKLGLGSSAAAVVAATALCLHAGAHPWQAELILELASQAHGDAQASLGARGSGADVACSVMGGCLRFEAGSKPGSWSLPPDLALVFPWTGRAASTAPLVAAVKSFASSQPAAYARLSGQIRHACLALAEAGDAGMAITALRAGGRARKDLGDAADVALWLPVHSQMAECAEGLGGCVKPTGAGGGDLAVAAFSSEEAASLFRREMQRLGISCPSLALDNQGVRLHP